MTDKVKESILTSFLALLFIIFFLLGVFSLAKFLPKPVITEPMTDISSVIDDTSSVSEPVEQSVGEILDAGGLIVEIWGQEIWKYGDRTPNFAYVLSQAFKKVPEIWGQGNMGTGYRISLLFYRKPSKKSRKYGDRIPNFAYVFSQAFKKVPAKFVSCPHISRGSKGNYR